MHSNARMVYTGDRLFSPRSQADVFGRLRVNSSRLFTFKYHYILCMANSFRYPIQCLINDRLLSQALYLCKCLSPSLIDRKTYCFKCVLAFRGYTVNYSNFISVDHVLILVTVVDKPSMFSFH